MPNDIATKLPAITTPHVPAMRLDEMQRLAESIAKSRLFGITTADQALTLMSIAQAEGRHPALAARDYHIIQGAPAKKAEAMLRDFLSSGGRVEWHELADDAAEATFTHPIGGSVRIRWDKDRVKQAGLSSNGMHAKYPRQMLRSRVVSEGVRTVWPMATSGMYVPEEVAEFAPRRHVEPIDITPKADLDQFADAAPSREPPVVGLARVEAQKGTALFRSFLLSLSQEEADVVRPLLGTREEPGELTRAAKEADARIAEAQATAARRAAERHDELADILDEPAPAAARPGEDRANETHTTGPFPRQGATHNPGAGAEPDHPGEALPHRASSCTTAGAAEDGMRGRTAGSIPATGATHSPAGTSAPFVPGPDVMQQPAGEPERPFADAPAASSQIRNAPAGPRAPASTEPAGAIDDAWLAAFAAVEPRLTGDLASDEYDWRGYADRLVEMCGQANAATRGALKVTRIEALQLMKRHDGGGWRQVMNALKGAA